MVAREIIVSGAWEYARSKTMLSRATLSKFGVSFTFEPRKSMRSARVDSRVMRTILGLAAAWIETGRTRTRTRTKTANKSTGKFRRNMELVYRTGTEGG